MQAPSSSAPALILGEDDHRIYLYKPANLPVFPPHGDPTGDCLLARWIALDPARGEGWPPGFEGGIAHRLDNGTSGLVIAARTPDTLAPLRAQFSARQLAKTYRFQSDAPAPFSERVITAPLAHHPKKKDRMIVDPAQALRCRGKWYPAWSRFTHLGGREWEVEIRTGVTHQIRAHAAWAGIPLAGDPIYGRGAGSQGVQLQGFRLHHARVDGPGWASPDAPLPPEWRAEYMRPTRGGHGVV